MCHHVLDFRLYLLAGECYSWPRNESLVLQSTRVIKMKDAMIKLLYIAMFEGGNNLCGERSGSAKEIARDTLHIWIVVACISIFDLLMIRYSCI